MKAIHSETAQRSEEESSKLRGRMAAMEAKIDDLMQLMAAMIKGKTTMSEPDPASQGVRPEPLPTATTETRAPTTAIPAREELTADNTGTIATNARAMGSTKNPQPFMQLDGDHHQELSGDDPYYTF